MTRRCLIAVLLAGAGLLAGCRSGDVTPVAPDNDPEGAGVQARDTEMPYVLPASLSPTLAPATSDGQTAGPTDLTSTSAAPGDHTPPTITHIATSTLVFTVSDCSITEVTVTADIADPSGVVNPTLWYRVKSQSYTPVAMQAVSADRYSVTVKGVDLPRNEYGVWEFYLTAQDKLGNMSQSLPDTTVQFLPCAAH